MISNPNLILYSCIAKGPTILTEFLSLSVESGISAIAQQCIERTPPHHSIFSHTIRNKTYAFLIQYPFAYFAICNEDLSKNESFWFLNRVKTLFEDLIVSNLVDGDDKFVALCFQSQFYPVFREILALDVELIDSSTEVSKTSRNPSMDSTMEKRSVVRPLLSKPAKVFMKKKKRVMGCVGESNADHQLRDHHNYNHHAKDNGGGLDCNKANYSPDNNGNVVLSRDFSMSMMQKNGGYCGGDTRQKAKQMWRKHVWVVLILDLVVCAVLFGIWLWVCRGFKCIDG